MDRIEEMRRAMQSSPAARRFEERYSKIDSAIDRTLNTDTTDAISSANEFIDCIDIMMERIKSFR